MMPHRMIVLEIWNVLSLLFQFFRSIKGIVRGAIFYQLFCILAVDRFALALAVWSKIAAVLGAFIGFKPAPTEGLINILFSAGHKARLVGVFDPYYKIA